MQTIVDLPKPQLEALNALNQTPSEFIAEVLTGVIQRDYFGSATPLSWEEMDGLKYERKIRAE